MLAILEWVNSIIWGVPALALILGVGIFLSIKTKFLQIRLFPNALRHFFSQFKRRKTNTEGISPYRALCTALGATVGTGNLAGVAGAIALGGPGVVFWMWVCGIVGMVTKFAEITLAMKYRVKNSNGEYIGGPMLMIRQGMEKKWHFLAYLYAFMGVVASFGVGNATQVNAVIGGIEEAASAFGISLLSKERFLLASGISVLILTVLLGGAKRIGKTAEGIIPFVAAGYILFAVFVLVVRYKMIPEAFAAIVRGAFTPGAVTGGMIASAFTAMRVGAARGVFTNEAGMGTASIAHASAEVDNRIHQGFMGIIEVFIDTIVICTLTALVILCSGVSVPYGTDVGISLTSQAFSVVCGKWINIPIAFALSAFALATILGWSLYGLRCAQFLFGDGIWKRFVILQGLSVLVGAMLKTSTVWILAEIVNGLMAIPNLIALFALTPELLLFLEEYENSGTEVRSRSISIK